MSDWIAKENELSKGKATLPDKVEKDAKEESKSEIYKAFADKDEIDVKEVRTKIIAPDPTSDLTNQTIYNDIYAELAEENGFISDKQAIQIFLKRSKEYEHESWILEGFPKTKIQALALGQNKIVPDKIFILKYSDEVAIEHIIQGLREKYGEEASTSQLEEIANRVMTEYHLSIAGVQELFGNIIHIVDAHGYVKGYRDDQNKISIFVSQIARLIHTKRASPDRKQRLIMVGHPGSGRSTQGELLARKFNLIHICTASLLKNEVRLKTERGKRIKECFSQSKLVPDEIICSLVEARIKQSDWKLNGWVLDGFPKNYSANYCS